MHEGIHQINMTKWRKTLRHHYWLEGKKFGCTLLYLFVNNLFHTELSSSWQFTPERSSVLVSTLCFVQKTSTGTYKHSLQATMLARIFPRACRATSAALLKQKVNPSCGIWNNVLKIMKIKLSDPTSRKACFYWYYATEINSNILATLNSLLDPANFFPRSAALTFWST